MRPRERDQEPPAPESSPPPGPPAARLTGNLSSMVVRPTDSAGGGAGAGGDLEKGEARNRRESPLRRRISPPIDLRRRRGSPPAFRRRESPIAFQRRGTPPDLYRRGGGGGAGSPAAAFRSRSQRFSDNPGYMPHAGSISPPPRRPKLDDDYDPEFDHPVGQYFGRGFRGGRAGGRFRDVSPHEGFGRGGRPIGRGHMLERRISPSGGEYVHRNDPNLSPREGDWICGSPRCGNLNFARRTYCNNCNKPRFAPGHAGLDRSPRRGYFTSPPRGSPPSLVDPALVRGIRRGIGSYRSPPRAWGSEVSRDFGTGSPPPPRRVGGRFQDHMRRDDRPLDYEDDFRGREKFDWPVGDDWNRRDMLMPARRGYDQRSPSPRDRWVRGSRDRSRSPLGARPAKVSHMGRGRGDRRFDDSYMDRGRRVDEPDLGRRGFHRDDDSFAGRGRGDRRGMARGRSNGDRY
ncbi:putative serine/arginine repetitive matrix protein 1 [Iris pallida]|uniref:Serine/arginine repetitive matrix protein 1 n=1 Tax=Iris pallida TaxID=29817 RepID=A0AAX6DZM8_IRIPA|nr:putative serine/arginine repetitive matrix protein 1 [Iris pallida]